MFDILNIIFSKKYVYLALHRVVDKVQAHGRSLWEACRAQAQAYTVQAQAYTVQAQAYTVQVHGKLSLGVYKALVHKVLACKIPLQV